VERELFRWKCVLVPADGPNGTPVEFEVSSYWSPKREWITDEFIAKSAAAVAWLESGKKQMFVGISAELIA
jgi:hypothetical protein